jgi:hypothetical protein
MPMLDTYLRMLSGSAASWDSRKRGVRRLDHLLSLEELERIADAGQALPPAPEELTEWKGAWGRKAAACSAAQSPAASSAPNATASSRIPFRTSKLRSTMSGL